MKSATSHSQTKKRGEEVLQGVSRSFALTIPQLPHPLRSRVTNGYLLCRIVDTIEDEENLSADEKAFFFRTFIEVVEGKTEAAAFTDALLPLLSERTLPAEKELIRETPWVVGTTLGFSDRQQGALKRCVTVMARGMERFQRIKGPHGLRDLAELDRYCYHVAGVVGEMLTELFCDYSGEIEWRKERLFALATSFGQGLQMTNILKDLWDDRRRGVCWLPRDLFEKAGFELIELSPGAFERGCSGQFAALLSLTRRHLGNALAYSLLIPPSETGIRKFCLWAIGLAVFTLRRIASHPAYATGTEVKISRSLVKTIILSTNRALRHDYLLKALFGLFTRDLPDIPAARREAWAGSRTNGCGPCSRG
jgi:farnesyl-diphosphate farnesyltransferase